MTKNDMRMAWNEPGRGGSNNKDKDKNPWGRGSGDQGGPPDLDQVFKKLILGIKNFFGIGNNKGSSDGGGRPFGTPSSMSGMNGFQQGSLVTIVVIVLVGIYILSGIYIVEPAERAVITCFGKYLRTDGPGPHWLPRVFENNEIVNVDRTETTRHSGVMLTQDENIVSVEVAVQYRINDARAYLFNVVNPENSLKQATESALRQVVGQSTLDDVLTSGRAQIATAIKDQIVSTLNLYQAGLLVLDVAMQPAKAPEEVRTAFDDVIKAREEEVRSVNQAESYANDILPKARGVAERMKKEALAYKQETQLIAEGSTKRFNLILPEFQKSPKITQTRLYLDTMQEILSKTSKILVEGGNNNLLCLPIDKLMSGKGTEEEKEKS